MVLFIYFKHVSADHIKLFITHLLVACFPRGKLLLFSVYVNSSQLTTRVEYFAIIRSRLIAECFVFIFYFNATAADMKKFRVSAYSRDRLIGE